MDLLGYSYRDLLVGRGQIGLVLVRLGLKVKRLGCL